MPIADYDTYVRMLDNAFANQFAYPAINVSSMVTANAALKAFADAKSDGMIQVSTGGGKFASGTSYATPFVTAALALAAAAEPGAPAERLRQTLLARSRDLGARGDDPVFGHGLVQLPACGAAGP